MRYTHYDELKKRWQINDDYGAVTIDELNYAVGEAIDKLAAYEDAEEDKGYILAPQEDYDGLKRKYVVLKSDSGEPVEDCFVLRPDKDKAAIAALLAYADATDNQVLAKDIQAWISNRRSSRICRCYRQSSAGKRHPSVDFCYPGRAAGGGREMKETIIRQYRKKPVIVEAVQLNNLNVPSVVQWIGEDKAKMNLESDEAWKLGKAPPIFSITICTLEGNMKAMPGDYIIKGVNGEFYPCKPDIFEKTYEAVEPPKEEE